jgi:hypothetical protein
VREQAHTGSPIVIADRALNAEDDENARAEDARIFLRCDLILKRWLSSLSSTKKDQVAFDPNVE